MDLLFFNGNIITMHSPARAAAIGVAAGRVVAVGDEAALRAEANEHTQLIDLKGRTLIPGFNDSHAHVWKIGHLLTTMVDLRGAQSFEAIGDQLRQRDKSQPQGAWLLGRGFNETVLAERRRPTRHDLDRFVADRPVVLTRTCGHIYAVNTLALRMAGITAATVAPDGGVIERETNGEGGDEDRGEPNGLLHETAMGLIQRVLPAPTPADYEAMIVAALRHQLSVGITSSSDLGVLPELLAVYLDMDRRGALPVRMNVMPLGRPDSTAAATTNDAAQHKTGDELRLPTQHESPMLRVDTVKFLADGGLSGATAALSVPFRNSTSTGVLRFQTEELRALFSSAHRQGWRIATHAIGDVAIEQVLALYEELGTHPRSLHHRVEHLGLPGHEQLLRLADIGVMVSTQPIFLDELGHNLLAVVPPPLLAQTYPFREMLAAGLTIAFSSDAPVVLNDDPLAGMQAAIERRSREGEFLHPEHSITAEEALHAYTLAGATLSGDERNRGSIREGRWADFAVLSGDPLKVAPDKICSLHVEQTYLGGRLVYDREGLDRSDSKS